jgi:hypothetical protein
MKILIKAILSIAVIFLTAQSFAAFQGNWRQVNEKELREIIPTRAPVEKERIETEFRTASAVTDGRGKFIAGAIIITAGYSAEGKYSHFFLTQVPLRVGSLQLPRGEYIFGYQRVSDDALEVKFYEAATGKPLGTVKAQRDNKRGAIRSFWVSPPTNGAFNIMIGRFAISCALAG